MPVLGIQRDGDRPRGRVDKLLSEVAEICRRTEKKSAIAGPSRTADCQSNDKKGKIIKKKLRKT